MDILGALVGIYWYYWAMGINLKAWGQDLRQMRERRGLSVQQAAAIHGMSDSGWNNWESGAVHPTGRLLRPVIAKWPEVRMPGDNSPRLVSLV